MSENKLNPNVTAQTSLQVGLRDLANVYVQDQLREHKGRLRALNDKFDAAKQALSEKRKELQEVMARKAKELGDKLENELRDHYAITLNPPPSMEVDIRRHIVHPMGELREHSEYMVDLTLEFRQLADSPFVMSGTVRTKQKALVGAEELVIQAEIEVLEAELDLAAKRVGQQRDFLATSHEWLPEAEAQITKVVAKSNGISDQVLTQLSSELQLLGVDRLPSIEG